jgi:hypothetical protein
MELFSYTSKSLQTTLAADAHLAEGQFLSEGLKLNIEKSLRYRLGIKILALVSQDYGFFNEAVINSDYRPVTSNDRMICEQCVAKDMEEMFVA